MRILFMPLPLVLLSAALAQAAPKADWFVAPTGKDTWSGTQPSANAEKSDGPFATVQRAQLAVRELKQREPQRTGAIVVMLRGGTYVLDKPLEFTAGDSGAAGAPVIYAAYPGEEPLLSGGVRLTGWETTPEGRWQLTIPQVQRGEWSFIQLFVNGQRRYRPRLPKEGYYTISDQLPPAAGAKGANQFRFKPGDILGNWSNLNDVEVLGFQNWTMARLRIAAVEEKENVVSFTGDTHGTQGYQSLPKGHRFIVENVREALDRPGQWYLDRKTGVLAYIPMPGEDAATAEAIAPRLESLLHLKGDVTKRQWVQHLEFRGLTFAHANWITPPEGNVFAQAEVNLPGAITAVGARHCLFDGCAVAHVGTWAIEFGQGCKSNVVENCSLTDLGAGGVKIGEMGVRDNDEDLTSGHVLRNNLIAGGGRLHPAAIGVWIGHSPENVIEHNDIYDFYYTGISIGWSWGYGRSQAHHNTVAWNRVWQIGQGVLSDLGGIYTLGVSPGSVIHHNIFHDIESFGYGGWGIYFDEGTAGMLAENNLVYRSKTGGFHQHYGKENVVRNNIFAFARQDGQIIRSRAEDHLSFTFQHNIVFWKDAPLLGSIWSGDNYALDYNLYWRTDGKPVEFAGMTLEQWQKKGQDAHSLIADPRFADPDKGDFNLQLDSPAAKIGFKPIDLSAAGLHPTPAQARHAALSVPRAFPSPAH
jgi:hypothetical protein